MIWPFRRRTPRPPQPSRAAIDSILSGTRELVEVRQLRQESQRVGSDLRRAHEANHIAAALEAAIAGRKTA